MKASEERSEYGSANGMVIGLTVFGALLFWMMFLMWWKRNALKEWHHRVVGRQQAYMQQIGVQRTAAPRTETKQYYDDFRLISQLVIDQTCVVARNPVNASKNRYRDVVPYDANRVVLQNNVNGDYINASYVERIFIATQDPMPDQDEDFWEMLWQSNTGVIIRLSSNSAEFPMAQYFPNIENVSWVFGAGETKVTTTAVRHLGNIRVIHLSAEKDGEQRYIILFHFTTWRAGSTPSISDVLELVSTAQVTKRRLGEETMVVVHCGAGSGRSGIIIALWQIMEFIQQGQQPNIFRIVSDMRNQRPGMVQTPEQYVFLHLCAKKYAASSYQWPGKDVFKKVNL